MAGAPARLSSLFDALPESLRCVVVGRGDVLSPDGIGADDLRLDDAEASALLRLRAGDMFGERRDLLAKTAGLGRVSGALADAVTGRADGAEALPRLAGMLPLVVPLDDRREWFGYHRTLVDAMKPPCR